jgi:cytoskeleton protein RodZ
VLVIHARAESWVQVRNGAGRVVLQKALAAGESYSAEGSPPWSVVVGRADATDVVVRGQPMDLKAIARENVARFEVE